MPIETLVRQLAEARQKPEHINVFWDGEKFFVSDKWHYLILGSFFLEGENYRLVSWKYGVDLPQTVNL